MKIILYFLIGAILCFNAPNFLNAQEVDNPQEEFMENTWYLSKIKIGGEDYMFESNEETEWTTLTTEQIENQTNFYLDYCAGASGYGLIFTSENSFVVDDFVISLVECEDPVNNNYKLMYFEIFEENVIHEFDVVITMENDHKSLIIITQDNSHLYYQNVPDMSVNDQRKSNLTLYPNPVQDYLYIENLTESVEIEIYELSGKMLLRQEVDNATGQVNVSWLSEGFYVYQLSQNGQKVKMGKLVKK